MRNIISVCFIVCIAACSSLKPVQDPIASKFVGDPWMNSAKPVASVVDAKEPIGEAAVDFSNAQGYESPMVTKPTVAQPTIAERFLTNTSRLNQVMNDHECNSVNLKELRSTYKTLRTSIIASCEKAITSCPSRGKCDNAKCSLDESDVDFLKLMSETDSKIIQFENACTQDLARSIHRNINNEFVKELIRAALIPKSDFTFKCQSVYICDDNKPFLDFSVECTGVECEGEKFTLSVSVDEQGNYKVEPVSGVCKIGVIEL